MQVLRRPPAHQAVEGLKLHAALRQVALGVPGEDPQAVVEGARLFKSDRELGLRTLQRWLKLDDGALLADTYAYFARAMPDRLLPREEGLQLVIDEVAAQRPEARALRPTDLVDPSLAAEVR